MIGNSDLLLNVLDILFGVVILLCAIMLIFIVLWYRKEIKKINKETEEMLRKRKNFENEDNEGKRR